MLTLVCDLISPKCRLMIQISKVLELPGWPKIHADVFDQILNPAFFISTGNVASMGTGVMVTHVVHKARVKLNQMAYALSYGCR